MARTQQVLQREYLFPFGEHPLKTMLERHRSAPDAINPCILDCLPYSLENVIRVRDGAYHPFFLSWICIEKCFFVAEVLQSFSSVDAHPFDQLAEDCDVFRGSLDRQAEVCESEACVD